MWAIVSGVATSHYVVMHFSQTTLIPRLPQPFREHGAGRMARSTRREREGCGAGAGGRPSSPWPERRSVPYTVCAGQPAGTNRWKW